MMMNGKIQSGGGGWKGVKYTFYLWLCVCIKHAQASKLKQPLRVVRFFFSCCCCCKKKLTCKTYNAFSPGSQPRSQPFIIEKHICKSIYIQRRRHRRRNIAVYSQKKQQFARVIYRGLLPICHFVEYLHMHIKCIVCFYIYVYFYMRLLFIYAMRPYVHTHI